jgi:hypothetical protein
MFGNRDVITDVRKLAGSKPVHAAAGAGVLASQALREIPGKLTRWRQETISGSLPVTEWPGRAAGYVSTARAKAAERYDQLADTGRQAIARHDDGDGGGARNALNGHSPQ